MKQKIKENFRSKNCKDCQCNLCLYVCKCCDVCYRSDTALENFPDFYNSYYKDKNDCKLNGR